VGEFLSNSDIEKLTAARLKREKKILRYTSTKQARKNRESSNWYVENWGEEYFWPTRYDPEGIE